MNWEEIREDAYRITRERQEKPIFKFLEEFDIKDNFFYKYSCFEKELIIFTNIPGIWIGKGGCGIDRLKTILKEELGKEIIVNVKEIRGNFLSR